MPKKKAPDKFQLLQFQEISYADIKRGLVRGLILDGPIDQVEIMLAGHAALKFAAKYLTDVQGVALFLWDDRDKIGVEAALVAVNWAPHGHWEWIGQYPVTDNIFAVEFNKQGDVDGEADDSGPEGAGERPAADPS